MSYSGVVEVTPVLELCCKGRKDPLVDWQYYRTTGTAMTQKSLLAGLRIFWREMPRREGFFIRKKCWLRYYRYSAFSVHFGVQRGQTTLKRWLQASFNSDEFFNHYQRSFRPTLFYSYTFQWLFLPCHSHKEGNVNATGYGVLTSLSDLRPLWP